MPLILPDNVGNTWSMTVNAADGSLIVIPAPGITPTPGVGNSITVQGIDLIRAAMQEIGALAGGESPSGDDQAWVLQKLQRIIDRFNAARAMVYNVNFSTFAIQANHTPHTIGPGGDFDVIQRPVEIPSIGLILVNTQPTTVEIPLTRRDQDWWANQRVKNVTSTIPTDYYYDPAWGTGNIWFWPVPTAVNTVLLQSRTVIAEITSPTQIFTMPPGYWDAIVYSLAVAIGPSFERPITADLRALMTESIRNIQGNNIKSPRGDTGDPGMPGIGIRGGFNYYSAQPSK